LPECADHEQRASVRLHGGGGRLVRGLPVYGDPEGRRRAVRDRNDPAEQFGEGRVQIPEHADVTAAETEKSSDRACSGYSAHARFFYGSYAMLPQHFLYFRPLPQGQRSLRPGRSDGLERAASTSRARVHWMTLAGGRWERSSFAMKRM